MAGCGGAKAPPPATPNAVATEDGTGTYRQQLTDAERDRLLEALRGVAADYESTDPPRPAEHGKRWSDLELALAEAFQETGVTAVATTSIEDGYRFDLKTLDDRRGVLVITRRPPPEIYAATATIGRLDPDDARADELLAALDRALVLFGKRRRF